MSLLLLLRSVYTVLPPFTGPTQVVLEMKFAGVWTEVKDWNLARGFQLGPRGFSSTSFADYVAQASEMSFDLDSSSGNSAKLAGYYSPDHANCRAGFDVNTQVRLYIVNGNGTSERFTGWIESIDPHPGTEGPRLVSVTATSWLEKAANTETRNLPVTLNTSAYDAVNILLSTLTFDVDRPTYYGFIGATNDSKILPYLFDKVRDGQTTIRDELVRLASSSADRLYEGGAGELTYEPRSRRSGVVDIKAVYTAHRGFNPSRSRKDVVNKATVTVHPRLPSVDDDVVLYSRNTPLAIGALQTITFNGPWTDPASPTTRVGAVDLQPLIPYVDYIVNVAADGSGPDLTGDVTAIGEDGGNTSRFTITMNIGVAGFITFLQQRGRAIYDYGAIAVTEEDATSIAAYGLNPQSVDMKYSADLDFARSVAQWIVYVGKAPKTRISEFVRLVSLNDLDALYDNTQIEIGDAITIIDEVSGISKSYFVNTISEHITEATHEVTFGNLTPLEDTQSFWRLGVSGRSELGITTRLGSSLFRSAP